MHHFYFCSLLSNLLDFILLVEFLFPGHITGKTEDPHITDKKLLT